MDLGVVGEVGDEPDQLQTFPVKAVPGFLQGDVDDLEPAGSYTQDL